MKKQVLASLAVFFLLTAAGCGTDSKPAAQNASVQQTEAENPQVSTSIVKSGKDNPHKLLVVYFSYPENTDAKAIHSSQYDVQTSASLKIKDGKAMGDNALIADYISEKTGADKFSILTENPYPSDYDETTSQGKEEIQKGELPALKSHLGDISGYDTIILLYPNWWSTLPAPVSTFLKENDLSGKQIYAVVTSGGSGFVQTVQTIQDAQPQADVHEGFSLYSKQMDQADQITQQWLDEMGY